MLTAFDEKCRHRRHVLSQDVRVNKSPRIGNDEAWMITLQHCKWFSPYAQYIAHIYLDANQVKKLVALFFLEGLFYGTLDD